MISIVVKFTVALAQITTIESSSHPDLNHTLSAVALPSSAGRSPTTPQQQHRQRAQQAKGGSSRQHTQGTACELGPQLQEHVHDAPDVRYFILEQTSANRKQPSQCLHKCMLCSAIATNVSLHANAHPIANYTVTNARHSSP